MNETQYERLSDILETMILNIRPDHSYHPVPGLPEEYPAYVYKTKSDFGVAVPAICQESMNEKFRGCRLKTDLVPAVGSALILSCMEPMLIEPFLAIASIFVDPGENGRRRQKLMANPALQWEEWTALFGNSFIQKKPYAVLAELLAYESLLKQHPETRWEGPYGATHDIETDDASFEIKATLSRTEWAVTIHGLYQAQGDKKEYLSIYRMEKNSGDESINGVIHRLAQAGVDHDLLWQGLYLLGYEKNEHALDEKYSVLETRVYTVDENFPKITPDSFKNNAIPENISELSYRVLLNGTALTYQKDYQGI